MASINTNYGALVALQNLTRTTNELEMVQNRVNTGLKVGSAKDNGAIYAIAQEQRSRVGAIASVSDGIDRVSNVIETGLAAGETISDLLTQMKEKAVAAQAADLSSTQRDALQADFSQLRDQVTRIANAATFNGANVVNGTNTTSALRVLMSDLNTGTGGGNVATLQGAAKPAADALVSRNANLIATFTEYDNGTTDLAANEYVRFVQGANTYAVQVTSGMTIQGYLDAVGAATGGRIVATFDDASGRLTYQANDVAANSAFTIQAATTASGAVTGRRAEWLTGVAGTGATGAATDAADQRPASVLQVTGFDLRIGGTGALSAAGSWNIGGSGTTGAATAATAIDAALTTLNSNLATLGSQAKALTTQKDFLGKLSGAVEKGIGQLVDADLAKESARLQALQVKQQLGAQALSIANQAPSIVLSFFR